MQIRKYQNNDWPQVWPIIEKVFQSGETYAYSTEITEDEAHKVWIDTPNETYVAVSDNNKILGTYYIKTNQPALGSHVCNCGYIVSDKPKNKQAKELLADALEQLGYQSESGPWRSVYLQGAYELRNGIPSSGGLVTATPDTIRAMSPDMLFDYLAVRLDSDKAAGKKFSINVDFTDLNSHYTLSVENAVLNHTKKQSKEADVTLKLDMKSMNSIQLGEATFDQLIKDGKVKLKGDKKIFDNFLAMLDTFNFWFNIVTP